MRLRFFCDRCFPKRLGEALKVLEVSHDFDLHQDYFIDSMPDVEWLKIVGSWEPKPIVISGDARILKKPDEIRELMSQNMFFVTMQEGWTSMPICDQAWKFLKIWPKLLEDLKRLHSPTVLKINCQATRVDNMGLTINFKK